MANPLSPQELTAWVKAHVERFTQSAFRITSKTGLVVYIDLFELLPDTTPADIVLITHEHSDHFHPDVVKSVLKPGTRVAFVAAMRAAGLDQGLATDALAPGETKSVGPLTVTAVPAYNLTAKFHPRAKQWVGYLFEIDGVRIYHAGDTDLIPEMTGLQVDVALLPVGGLFTMDAKEAAKAAGVLNAGVVVPMHYGKVPMTGGAGQDFSKLWSGTTVLMETHTS